MIGFFIRSIWRLIVLGLGVGLAYLSAFVAFPYLDKRLPFFIALIVVYVGLAYFALPALLRTWRLLIRPDHIPLYVTSRDGWPAEPVNIAVVAKSRRQLVQAMQRAGWYQADKVTFGNWIREGYAILFDKPYPNAPFSPLYLFNRPFDIGFELPYGENLSPRHRHHVRFWQLVNHREDHGHFRFWIRHLQRFIGREKTVWIGAATDDVSIYGVRWRNLQITHRTHPLHYRERDFIIDSLNQQNVIKDISEVKAGDPFKFQGQYFGTSLVSDGRLSVIELKNLRKKV